MLTASGSGEVEGFTEGSREGVRLGKCDVLLLVAEVVFRTKFPKELLKDAWVAVALNNPAHPVVLVGVGVETAEARSLSRSDFSPLI